VLAPVELQCIDIADKVAPMRNSSTVLAIALVACMALPAHAQQKIGKATSVKPQAQGSVVGELAPDADIHANETVNTSTAGQANLQFLDSTMLSVGPMSTVRLDKFVYDPSKGTGTVVVNATRGAYRFVTGVQDSRSYTIKTPYATLGVRGTVLEVVIQEPVRGGRTAGARRTSVPR
jgi:hypothetical protein